ncbi:hypothetical protein LTR84_012568 [Exophiala bonariae]|uniref:Uncharacterized protein n=1 Tax=Exophiala bonariae TaxID=1690606 RepID=A0AAV9NIS9_9EURO|nr:hypothetical protein LTR84_012568 [Exophiala bonariae]
MASMGDSKQFKQDLVVSVRYRNDLPPPPMPPKLLDIDTGGLAQYLTTGYASSLAKREEPNIEVDAEGGMSIDMIGVPGYFLGDESAIMAPDVLPVVEPADQALLLTLEQLKSQGAMDNVSFLRKTQYMNSGQLTRAPDALIRPGNPKMRKMNDSKPMPMPVAKDDKENIKRHIQKGFNIAYPESIPHNPPEAKANPITQQERDAWRNPIHPDNPRLKPVGFYPIIPDLEAGTDLGGSWYQLKFDKPPLATYRGRKDDRMDAALLGGTENQEKQAEWLIKKKAFDEQPDLYEDPGPEPYTWTLFVPKQHDSGARYHQIFDDSNPNKDDPTLVNRLLEESADGTLRLPFERARIYPNNKQQPVVQDEAMAISIVDPDKLPSHSRFRKQGPAAYYYPIVERIRFKADRGNLGKAPPQSQPRQLDEDVADQVMVSFREANDSEKFRRAQFLGQFDPSFEVKYEELARANEAFDEAARLEAEAQEQDELQQSAQDVTMEEADEDEKADAGTNGITSRNRDDDDDDSPPLDRGRVNGHGRPGAGVDDDDDDDDDEMQDD